MILVKHSSSKTEVTKPKGFLSDHYTGKVQLISKEDLKGKKTRSYNWKAECLKEAKIRSPIKWFSYTQKALGEPLGKIQRSGTEEHHNVAKDMRKWEGGAMGV